MGRRLTQATSLMLLGLNAMVGCAQGRVWATCWSLESSVGCKACNRRTRNWPVLVHTTELLTWLWDSCAKPAGRSGVTKRRGGGVTESGATVSTFVLASGWDLAGAFAGGTSVELASVCLTAWSLWRGRLSTGQGLQAQGRQGTDRPTILRACTLPTGPLQACFSPLAPLTLLLALAGPEAGLKGAQAV